MSSLIPYCCSGCRGVTLDEPNKVAVPCKHCGRIDLGTELARDRWRAVAEIQIENKPDAPPCMRPETSRLDGARRAIGRLFDHLGVGSQETRRQLDQVAAGLARMPDEQLTGRGRTTDSNSKTQEKTR
jgi:hypothetical protein